MRQALAATCAVVALAAAACDGADPAPAVEQAEVLQELPLREDEAPEGLAPAQASGPLDSFRDVLPPSRVVPFLPPPPKEVSRGFEAGYQTVYLSKDDAAEALTSATSTAVRFSGQEVASRFLAFLRQAQEATVRTEGRKRLPEAGALVEAPSLGDGGYGWHRTLPGGETSGYVWRRGDLVMTLSLSGSIGSAPAAAALELARTIDGRL